MMMPILAIPVMKANALISNLFSGDGFIIVKARMI